MADKQVYALDEGGNRVETLSAEKILEAIETAIKTGEIPAELQTFIDTIREQNKGAGLKFWLGTQAEFLALESTSEDVIYFINDSTSLRDVADALAKLSEQLEDGSFKVKKSEAADSAANVSEKINNKAVTDIFEKDGVTAKKATKAEAADSAENIVQTVIFNGTASFEETFETSEIMEAGRRYLIAFDDGSLAEGTAYAMTDGESLGINLMFPTSILNDQAEFCFVALYCNKSEARWTYNRFAYYRWWIDKFEVKEKDIKIKKIIKCEKYDI